MLVYTDGKAVPLVTWNYLKQNFPWDVILLLGGGFALAEGTIVSLSKKVKIIYWIITVQLIICKDCEHYYQSLE